MSVNYKNNNYNYNCNCNVKVQVIKMYCSYTHQQFCVPIIQAGMALSKLLFISLFCKFCYCENVVNRSYKHYLPIYS